MEGMKILRLCAIALASGMPLQAADVTPSRPNVLLIICDDLNDWALHPPGHPRARTPWLCTA